jgi:hypothetical protein
MKAFSYANDAQGNPTHLLRSSNPGSTLMDDLTYHYQNGTNITKCDTFKNELFSI